MHLEIITPDLEIFKGEASAVRFPGLDGAFQVLNDHAPIISALKGGEVKVDLEEAFQKDDETNELISAEKGNNKVINISIKGGVMEMLNNKIIVLAE